MTVGFRKKNLRKLYEKHAFCQQKLDQAVCRKYIQRVNLIKAARDFGEFRALPGLACHLLEPKHRGFWAVKLTGFYRLIISVDEDLNEITIEDVVKHYGD